MIIYWLLARDLKPTWLGAWVGKVFIIGFRLGLLLVGLAMVVGLVMLVVLDA